MKDRIHTFLREQSERYLRAIATDPGVHAISFVIGALIGLVL